MSAKIYTVLGAGRQGKAAAYDLAKFGETKAILLADQDSSTAKEAASELNFLLGSKLVHPITVNARSTDAVYDLLMESAGFVSAVHYNLNFALTELAIETGCHMVDLGGNTSVVLKQHTFDKDAKKRGVRIIPDCGMAPGFNINLACYALQKMSRAKKITIYCGGIPQKPKAPLGYHFPFAISGLVNECSGLADVIRDGAVTKQLCLRDVEKILIPEIGALEATHTSGGLSTAPWTFWEKHIFLDTLEYKTLRYPGHWDVLQRLISRGELESYLEIFAKTTPPDVEDVGIISVHCDGTADNGKSEKIILDVVDRYEPFTRFTAMQRLTGFHASIVLIAATGTLKEFGVLKVEEIDPKMVVNEFMKRGVFVEETRAMQA